MRLITIIVVLGTLTLFDHRAAGAEIHIIQHPDGRNGVLTPLGDQIGIYANSHGDAGPVVTPQGLGPTGPHGEPSVGAATPFGTPPPPNNLTPAPLLPINPNRPLPPQSSMPPSPAAPPFAIGPSNGGRFGR